MVIILTTKAFYRDLLLMSFHMYIQEDANVIAIYSQVKNGISFHPLNKTCMNVEECCAQVMNEVDRFIRDLAL